MSSSFSNNEPQSFPQHLETYFMRRKQDKLIALTNFVKRYYVFSMKSPGTLTYYKSKRDWQTNANELATIYLSVSIIDPR